jgi:hypothetical protein
VLTIKLSKTKKETTNPAKKPDTSFPQNEIEDITNNHHRNQEAKPTTRNDNNHPKLATNQKTKPSTHQNSAFKQPSNSLERR